MSRVSTSGLLAAGARQSILRPSLSNRITPPFIASFSRSASKLADRSDDPSQNLLNTLRGAKSGRESSPPNPNPMGELANASSRLVLGTLARAQNATGDANLAEQIGFREEETKEPYHFHIYSHRHNTHITVTNPSRNAILSLSCGNLGFKKSQRKTYDSAYQLGAYVIDRLQQQGWHKKIKSMEVVLRGFGPGREAVTKVLLGSEGRMLRPSIIRVADSTRLKFGGTRSRKPRRLG